MTAQLAATKSPGSHLKFSKGTSLLNVVEPHYLIDTFLKNPPLRFQSMQIENGGLSTPAFLADFDLTTTLDEGKAKDFIRRVPGLNHLLNFPTLFVGTTTTEYSTYPDAEDFKGMISSLLHELRKCRADICIVKDIPQQSPLLSKKENDRAQLLLRQLKEAGFHAIEGQALAYVPIDFVSIDDYMKRLSRSRRKEFRKKLRDSADIRIEEVSCGDSAFFDELLLERMYGMYMEVFQQSEIHFDILSRGFFRTLLQDGTGGGKVFLYKKDGRLIGYNICFVHNNRLVDKYIGFSYPAAREANLYFLSWFYNLEYALRNGLECYIAGWTDPQVKAALGAKFTMTTHAVYVESWFLRALLKPFKHMFESDSVWNAERQEGDNES